MEDTNYIQIERGKSEMLDAIVEAKRTIGKFLEAYRNPRPNQSSFHFKVEFEADGELEYIWVTSLELDTDPISGVIANDGRLPGLTSGKRVTFGKPQVSDWMYMENGAMVGGYTTRVLMKLRRKQVTTGLVGTLVRKFGRKKTVQ